MNKFHFWTFNVVIVTSIQFKKSQYLKFPIILIFIRLETTTFICKVESMYYVNALL